jgi:hypothetical protein
MWAKHRIYARTSEECTQIEAVICATVPKVSILTIPVSHEHKVSEHLLNAGGFSRASQKFDDTEYLLPGGTYLKLFK